MPSLVLETISTNNTDRIITVAINGKRYEYEFQDAFESVLAVYNGLMKSNQYGKALTALKAHATKVTKV
jgi:hypothetical protein